MTELVPFLQTLPVPALVAFILALGFVSGMFLKAITWIFNEWWQSKKSIEEKKNQAIASLTLAVTKLEVRFEQLNALLGDIPKLKADVDYAHEKIRTLQNP